MSDVRTTNSALDLTQKNRFVESDSVNSIVFHGQTANSKSAADVFSLTKFKDCFDKNRILIETF